MGRPSKYNWKAIKLDYECGITQAEIVKKHNVPHSRLSATIKAKEWQVSQQANSIIGGFDEVSQQTIELSNESPELAKNVVDIVLQKHPQFKKAMLALSGAIFKRGMEIAPEANATDLNALSKAMQTTTDTIGVSQRHSNNQVVVNTQTNVQQIQKIERVIIDTED